MRRLVFISIFSLATACGRSHGAHDDAPTTPNPDAQGTPGPEAFPERADREAEVVAKFKTIGVDLKLWDGQESAARKTELEQLEQLLPEIEARKAFIRTLEISGYKFNWYQSSAKHLQIDLTNGVPAAKTYLQAFDRMRAYEARLGGVLIERAGETAELLDQDLAYYQVVDLVAVVHDRPYIKVVEPSGMDGFVQGRGILYIKIGTNAGELLARVEKIGHWQRLSTELGITIESDIETMDTTSFDAAIDRFWEQLEAIRPVTDLVRTIRVVRDFGKPQTFDLGTGLFQMSRYDAAEAGDLWAALASYKRITTTLGKTVDLPDYLRDDSARLRAGTTLVEGDLALLQSKSDRFSSVRLSAGETTKIGPDGALWVSVEDDAATFRAFVSGL